MNQQFGKVVFGGAPDAFILNFAIVMRKNVALPNDQFPRQFWMEFPERFRDVPSCFTDNFHLAFDGRTEHLIVEIVFKRFFSEETHYAISGSDHIVQAGNISWIG